MDRQGRFLFDKRPTKDEELKRLIALGSLYETYVKKILKKIEKKAKKEIKRIIDIGTGTGDSAILLKEIFPDADVTCFDCSKELLMHAKKMAEEKDKSLNFILGDILSYDFPDKYDLIFSKFALKHIYDPSKAVFVMSRILNTDGIICIIDKDVYSNIWFPLFPLFGSQYMKALNKYNAYSNRGGDSGIGRKIKHYLVKNSISIQEESILYFNLLQNTKKERLYKNLYIEVYKNLVPELVNEKLITKEIAEKDIEELIGFLDKPENTAIISDFVVWGIRK